MKKLIAAILVLILYIIPCKAWQINNTVTDSNQYFSPDSTSIEDNEVGLNMQVFPGWKIIDSRLINMEQKFTGIIITLDSANTDNRGIIIVVLIDDPANSHYNKST